VILSDALSKLPKQYREIVIRRNLEGQSFPEIAKEMGRSLDSVKNAWFRAFDQLRQLLKAAA
jgi:RNA polymerase sigma-70 factor (ECF subfamily)